MCDTKMTCRMLPVRVTLVVLSKITPTVDSTLMVVLFRRNNRDWQFGKQDAKRGTRDAKRETRNAKRGTRDGGTCHLGRLNTKLKIMSIMPVGETMMPVGETMMPVGEKMMTVGENPVRASRLWLAAPVFFFKNTIESF
jgi:hypothetical protein